MFLSREMVIDKRLKVPRPLRAADSKINANRKYSRLRFVETDNKICIGLSVYSSTVRFENVLLNVLTSHSKPLVQLE